MQAGQKGDQEPRDWEGRTTGSSLQHWVLYDAANLPPPGGESQISDLEVWDTGDLADRVLMSARDVYLPCRTIPGTNHDDSGIPDL